MALIKCSECQREISDKAKICPHCGMKVKQKISGFLLIVIIIVSVVFLCGTIGGAYYLWADSQEPEVEEYTLFKKSYILEWTDPYGLAHDNNIIGKEISEVLQSYIEGVDYTKVPNDTETVYSISLPSDDDFFGENCAVLIYVKNGETKVDRVGYVSRYAERNSIAVRSDSIRNELTRYYDVDPIYEYWNGEEKVEIDVDKFWEMSQNANIKTVYHISWYGEKGVARLILTNLYDEKLETCNMIFYGAQ